MNERKLICIGWPLGCSLTVEMEGEKILRISGNTCRRGERYARDEVTNPVRMVTTTVRVEGGEYPVVSVKTKEAIPKARIMDCIRELKNVTMRAPVRAGDIVLKNAAGTGIEIIATKDIHLSENDKTSLQASLRRVFALLSRMAE